MAVSTWGLHLHRPAIYLSNEKYMSILLIIADLSHVTSWGRYLADNYATDPQITTSIVRYLLTWRNSERLWVRIRLSGSFLRTSGSKDRWSKGCTAPGFAPPKGELRRGRRCRQLSWKTVSDCWKCQINIRFKGSQTRNRSLKESLNRLYETGN